MLLLTATVIVLCIFHGYNLCLCPSYMSVKIVVEEL